MEKSVKRPAGLTVLFWRYLLTVGISIVTAALIWWAALGTLFHMGIILPAAYAASHIQETADSFMEDFEHIPHYYRWAVFDTAGETVSAGNMDSLQLEYARQSLLYGSPAARHFPYTQYHMTVPLRDERLCVLQYDYSVPYADPNLQKILPDFQLIWSLLLVILWVLLAALCTRHYTRLFRQDAQTIARATRAIAEQRLDKPFSEKANVRELGEALEAMDFLRQNLSESLERQWAMEQQRQRDLASLAHDLKTPLTIISGNGELLAEEPLSDTQRESVDAILRGAERLEEYAGRLRAFSAGEKETFTCVSLTELYGIWQEAGTGLCGPKAVRFSAQEPPELTLYIQREAVSRTVLNLLDNAARYAGTDGKVVLSARIEENIFSVTVTDTGPGFSPEALVRAGREPSLSSRPGHMGWGLYRARQVMRDHGGELRLMNTESGALAELRWPVRKFQTKTS